MPCLPMPRTPPISVDGGQTIDLRSASPEPTQSEPTCGRVLAPSDTPRLAKTSWLGQQTDQLGGLTYFMAVRHNGPMVDGRTVPDSQAKKHAAGIVRRLNRTYPEAECALVYDSPLQLLVATILSAQCTDERVNLVTRDLFTKYPTASDLAALSQSDMERLVKSTGFFRNKAKNIRACCEYLERHHGGEVPPDLDQLVQLPGVGRKTANVVLGTAFGLATGVVVDTHVSRLSQRLGMTAKQDPVQIEQDLMAQVPRKDWIGFSHRLIHHGRQVCKARRPLCDACSLADVCPKKGV